MCSMRRSAMLFFVWLGMGHDVKGEVLFGGVRGADSSTVSAMNNIAPVRSTEPTFRALNWTEQAVTIFKKDLAIELRSGELVTTTSFFGFLVVVIASIAFHGDARTRPAVAAGAIWLATVFAAVLSLSRGWQRERDNGVFEALLVSPISHSAIFMGKTIGLTLFLLVVEAVVIPSAAFLMNQDLLLHGGSLCVIALLATPGIAASGTLFGVMTVRGKAGALVLGMVLLPLLAPTILAAVLATRDLFDGTPFAEITGVLVIMAVFDLVFIAGGLSLFESLADGG